MIAFYRLGKVFGEGLAQLYWEKYGLEAVSIRIGSCERVPSNRRHLRTWLSFDDLAQLVERSLTVPRLGHMVVYGMSSDFESFWDNRLAPLGYRPQDSEDAWRNSILGAAPAPDPNGRLFSHPGGIWVA